MQLGCTKFFCTFAAEKNKTADFADNRKEPQITQIIQIDYETIRAEDR